jgi:hypothetical protein
MTSKKNPSGRVSGKTRTAENKTSAKKAGVYGENTPICANVGCVLRKKAKCSGFEGCPGFKAK